MNWLSEWIETLRVAPPFSRRRRELLAAIREFEGVEVTRPVVDRRPCKGRNSNVCVGEGCYGEACLSVPSERMDP